MSTVVVWTPRRRKQIPQHPEGWRGNMASALPPCFNADVLLPRLAIMPVPAVTNSAWALEWVCILFRAPEEAPPHAISPMSPYDAMRSNLQAVSPRIAARSASLKLGVPRICSTAILVHG